MTRFDMQEMSPNTGLSGIEDLTSGRANREVRPIGLDRIDVLDSARPVDQKTVDDLYESIHRNGLLQPIGVRRNPDKPGYVTLIWGRHRYEAFQKGYRLNYPREGHWVTIPAVFYTESLTPNDAEMLTLLENLQRHELSAAEKDSHRARIAVLLKVEGVTHDKTVSEQRAIAGQASRGGQGKAPNRLNSKGDNGGTSRPAVSGKPSTAQEVANRTGVTPHQANTSVRNVLDRARKADPGFDPERKLNLATASPADLSKAADLSDIQAKQDKELRKQHKPEPAVRPDVRRDHVPPHIFGLIERAYGEGGEKVFKLAVDKMWRREHPQGRVVFNVDFGAPPGVSRVVVDDATPTD